MADDNQHKQIQNETGGSSESDIGKTQAYAEGMSDKEPTRFRISMPPPPIEPKFTVKPEKDDDLEPDAGFETARRTTNNGQGVEAPSQSQGQEQPQRSPRWKRIAAISAVALGLCGYASYSYVCNPSETAPTSVGQTNAQNDDDDYTGIFGTGTEPSKGGLEQTVAEDAIDNTAVAMNEKDAYVNPDVNLAVILPAEGQDVYTADVIQNYAQADVSQTVAVVDSYVSADKGTVSTPVVAKEEPKPVAKQEARAAIQPKTNCNLNQILNDLEVSFCKNDLPKQIRVTDYNQLVNFLENGDPITGYKGDKTGYTGLNGALDRARDTGTIVNVYEGCQAVIKARDMVRVIATDVASDLVRQNNYGEEYIKSEDRTKLFNSKGQIVDFAIIDLSKEYCRSRK